MRIEGALGFGQGRGHHADLIAVAGWQGLHVVSEIGFGGSVVWGAGPSPRRRELGRLLHAGLGVRLGPSLNLLARLDLLPTENMMGTFAGLALEWQPWAP